MNDVRLELAGDRVAEFLKVLEMMAAGDMEKRIHISDRHDELDAIGHGINVLVGELGWATGSVVEAEQERAAREERETWAKKVFFRNMSHELRTPISAMLGFAELLSTGAANIDREELLKRLQANGRAVLSLLDGLLDLAKLDADKIVLLPEPVSVVDLVREVLASLQLESRAKGLQMRVEAADEALGALRTDRYRLRQILVNLASNAVKFTDVGSITVTLRVTSSLDNEWVIDFTDTGIGIVREQQARVFEPFEQTHDSTARSYGGNGLGLALSRKLAVQLGGSLVLLYSAPGEGTTFRLTVRPLKAAPTVDTPPAPVKEPVADPVPSIAGLRLLLAEDHRDLHLALRALLEQAGATVESVHDGREALARVSVSEFDAVLMDLRMPNMDGIQATRALRSQGYAVPIIALTADPATFRRVEALNAGCDACLSKPFTPDDLISAIRLSTRPSAV
jgi:signal transduction histidine kinase